MHLMLQRDEPADFVVATGESHTVREFCELAFGEAGLNYQDFVIPDEQFYRPAEVESLIGDSTKARIELGWQPEFDFRGLVKDMVLNDLATMAGAASTAASTATNAP
jgi:GDPmannose 4,6-dehydratase